MAHAHSLTVVGAVLLAAITGPARAACNAIPNAAAVLAQAPNSTAATQIEATRTIGYKGSLGWIDAIYLLPGRTKSFVIRMDGGCVTEGQVPPLQIPPGQELAPDDLMVTLMIAPTAGPRLALVYAAADLCHALSANPDLNSKEASVRLLGCVSDRVTIEPPESGSLAARVSLPGPGELPGIESGGLPDGSATVAMLRRPDSPDRVAGFLRQIATHDCARSCADIAQSGGLACVDQIYTLQSVAGALAYKTDPVPCVVQVATIPLNDFKAECEDEPNPDPSLVSCTNTPVKLQFWQDQCGGIHIPFDWQTIRRDTSGNLVRRELAGQGGTYRGKQMKGQRVWLPGGEFAGSTPVADPQGKAPTTDWRFPEVDVWYPSGASEEVGLIGSVDEDSSIVHVFPSLRVSVVCDTTPEEACMAVEGRRHGSSLGCACRDRYAAGCDCKKASVPRYFACAGGPFDQMPCTRTQHCNPGGTCSAQPTCQAEGETWREGLPAATGTPCVVTDDCDQAAGKPQCGYRLFNFGDRAVNTIVTLDAKITQATPRQERGVCKKKRSASCTNVSSAPKACVPPDGECRGYVLQARGKR